MESDDHNESKGADEVVDVIRKLDDTLQEKRESLRSFDKQIESLMRKLVLLSSFLKDEIIGVNESLSIVKTPSWKYADMELLPAVFDVIQTSRIPEGLTATEIALILKYHGFEPDAEPSGSSMVDYSDFSQRVFRVADLLGKEGRIRKGTKGSKPSFFPFEKTGHL